MTTSIEAEPTARERFTKAAGLLPWAIVGAIVAACFLYLAFATRDGAWALPIGLIAGIGQVWAWGAIGVHVLHGFAAWSECSSE